MLCEVELSQPSSHSFYEGGGAKRTGPGDMNGLPPRHVKYRRFYDYGL